MNQGSPARSSTARRPLAAPGADGGWALARAPAPRPASPEPEWAARTVLAVTARAWGLTGRAVALRYPRYRQSKGDVSPFSAPC